MVDMVKAAATAKRLIEENGRTVTFYKLNRDPDAPAEPWLGTSTPPDPLADGDFFDAIVSFVPPSGTGFGRSVADQAAQLNVTLQQIGLLASDSIPVGVNVEEFDNISDGPDNWKIVVRDHLRPADVSIMFAVGLTR